MGRRDAVAEVGVGAEGIRSFFLWRNLLRFVVRRCLAVVLVLALRDTSTPSPVCSSRPPDSLACGSLRALRRFVIFARPWLATLALGAHG